MKDNKEALRSSGSGIETKTMQPVEQNRVGLYEGVLFREATSLLGEYLPEALPQV